MVCDSCGSTNATVHLTEIINGNVREIHLCEECARKKTAEFNQEYSVADFFSELVNLDLQSGKPPAKAVACSRCGMTYSEFKKIGRVGCENCYVAFRDYIYPLLRKIHGGIRHKGKMPSTFCEPQESAQERLAELRQQLERAVKLEEYETAARLRDEIKSLETGCQLEENEAKPAAKPRTRRKKNDGRNADSGSHK